MRFRKHTPRSVLDGRFAPLTVADLDASDYFDDTDVAEAVIDLGRRGVLAGGCTFGVIGDSITNLDQSGGVTRVTNNWHGYLQILSGGRFRRTVMGATSGGDTATLHTNHTATITGVTTPPEYCFCFTGTNDSADVAGGLADLDTMTAALVAGGVTPVLVMIPPRNDSGAEESAQWNAGVIDRAHRNGWPIFDAYTPLLDHTTGGALAAYMTDDVHPNYAGHRRIVLHALNDPTFMAQFTRPKVPYVQQTPSDGVNLIPSNYGLFLTGSGVATGLSNFSGGAIVMSRETDADGTVWQRATKPAGNSQSVLLQGLTVSSGFTAGSTVVEFAGRVRTSRNMGTAATGGGGVTTSADCRDASSSLGSIPALYTVTGVIPDGRFRQRLLVPTGTTSIRFNLQWNAPVTEECYVEWANLTLRVVTDVNE